MLNNIKAWISCISTSARQAVHWLVWGVNWYRVLGALLSMLCLFAFLAIVSFLLFFGVYWFSVPRYESLESPIYFNYSDNLPSDSIAFDPTLKPADPFRTSPAFQFVVGTPTVANIDLTLPESQENRDVGIFMITLDLLAADDSLLLSISRPCSLRYRSFLRSTLQTLVTFPLMLVGLADETQHISLLMAPHIIPPSKDKVPKKAKVTLQDRRAQIHEAKLQFNSHFSLFKDYMYHHWFLASLTFIPLIFTILTSIALTCIAAIGFVYLVIRYVQSTPSTSPSSPLQNNNEGDQYSSRIFDSDHTAPPLSRSSQLVSSDTSEEEESPRILRLEESGDATRSNLRRREIPPENTES